MALDGSPKPSVSAPAAGSGITLSSTSLKATLLASQDDYNPTGYTASMTNRMELTPASGGSTLLGLIAGMHGWSVQIINLSTTDSILFSHQASDTPTNQFTCPGGVTNTLGPTTGCWITYVTGQGWMFIS